MSQLFYTKLCEILHSILSIGACSTLNASATMGWFLPRYFCKQTNCAPKHNFYLVTLLVNAQVNHPLKKNTINTKFRKYCKNFWPYISTLLRNFQNYNIEMSEWLIQRIIVLLGTFLMVKIFLNIRLQRSMLAWRFNRAIFAKPEKSFRFRFGCSIVIPIRNDVDEGLLLYRNNKVSI